MHGDPYASCTPFGGIDVSKEVRLSDDQPVCIDGAFGTKADEGAPAVEKISPHVID